MKKNKRMIKRDWNKMLLITLLILLLLEIVLIPCLIYAEVKRVLPIIMFLILPTICGIALLLLSKNCATAFQNKKTNLTKKYKL